MTEQNNHLQFDISYLWADCSGSTQAAQRVATCFHWHSPSGASICNIL